LNHVFLLSNIDGSRNVISFRVVKSHFSVRNKLLQKSEPLQTICTENLLTWSVLAAEDVYFLLMFTLIKPAESQRPQFDECNYTG